MTPLEAALALAEVRDRAAAIADDLDLDMAGAGHQALDQDRAVAKGGCGFRLAALVRLGDLIDRRHDPHPATAAAGDRLDHHCAAVAKRLKEGGRFRAIDRSGAAGQDRHIMFGGQGPCLRFVAEQFQRIDGRSDEGDPLLVAAPGQLGTLSEEAVAGVQGIATSGFCRLDHCLDIEVRARSGAVQRDRLIGAADVERTGVVLGVNGDGADSQFSCGANDSDGDLAAIRDQELVDRHSVSFVGEQNSGGPGTPDREARFLLGSG